MFSTTKNILQGEFYIKPNWLFSKKIYMNSNFVQHLLKKFGKLDACLFMFINYTNKYNDINGIHRIPFDVKFLSDKFNVSEKTIYSSLNSLVENTYIKTIKFEELSNTQKEIYLRDIDNDFSMSKKLYINNVLPEYENEFKFGTELSTILVDGELLVDYKLFWEVYGCTFIYDYCSEGFILKEKIIKYSGLSTRDLKEIVKKYFKVDFNTVDVLNSYNKEKVSQYEEVNNISQFRIRTANTYKITKEGLEFLKTMKPHFHWKKNIVFVTNTLKRLYNLDNTVIQNKDEIEYRRQILSEIVDTPINIIGKDIKYIMDSGLGIFPENFKSIQKILMKITSKFNFEKYFNNISFYKYNQKFYGINY